MGSATALISSMSKYTIGLDLHHRIGHIALIHTHFYQCLYIMYKSKFTTSLYTQVDNYKLADDVLVMSVYSTLTIIIIFKSSTCN